MALVGRIEKRSAENLGDGIVICRSVLVTRCLLCGDKTEHVAKIVESLYGGYVLAMCDCYTPILQPVVLVEKPND